MSDRLRRDCAGSLVDRDRIAGNNLVCEVARRTCRIHADYLRALLIHADDHALLLNRDLLRPRQHRQRRFGLLAVLRRNVDLRAAHLQRRNRALLIDGRNFRIRHGIAAQAVCAARGRKLHCRPRAHANAQLIVALCEGNAGGLAVDLHGQHGRLAVVRRGRDLRAALLHAFDNAGGGHGYIALVARLEGIARCGIRRCADDIPVLRQIQRIAHADLQCRPRKRDAFRRRLDLDRALRSDAAVGSGDAYDAPSHLARRNLTGSFVDGDAAAGNDRVFETARRALRIHAGHLRARLSLADQHL